MIVDSVRKRKEINTLQKLQHLQKHHADSSIPGAIKTCSISFINLANKSKYMYFETFEGTWKELQYTL